MKAFLVLALAFIAMASGGRVHVVDQPGDQIIIANPDPAFYQGGQNANNNPGHVHVVDQPGDQIIITNPDPGFYQGGQNGPGLVPNIDPGFYQPNPNVPNILINPDPYFYQGGQGVGSGSRPKQYDSPFLRGGK